MHERLATGRQWRKRGIGTSFGVGIVRDSATIGASAFEGRGTTVRLDGDEPGCTLCASKVRPDVDIHEGSWAR